MEQETEKKEREVETMENKEREDEKKENKDREDENKENKEQEDEKKEARNAEEVTTEAQPSGQKTPKSLKAKSKIVKKSTANDSTTQNSKINSKKRLRIIKKKNKTLPEGQNGSCNAVEENSKKLTLEEGNQKEDSKKEDTNKSQQGLKNQEEISLSKKSRRRRQRKEDMSLRNQKNEEKHNDKEKIEENDKLGGLIFMCSKKTKPDCFHYRVMGVSASKKDLVLGIKPGLKLFLYDFDLKLMYGIYKASSSGGMKLEPKAFGGAFPVQVRFNIQNDCYPLPESVFKTAIKENYTDKHKFKIELTHQQVRKLSKLFRPASLHATAVPALDPPMPKVRDKEAYAGRRESNVRDREVHAGRRKSNVRDREFPAGRRESNVREWEVHAGRRASDRENFGRDPYANGRARISRELSRERGLSQERDHHYVRSSRREENRHDLYLSEKEYRTYGLQRKRKTLSPPRHAAPLEPYEMGHERGHQLPLSHLDPVYRDSVPAPREPIPADPIYLSERNYQPYNVGARQELRSAVSPVTAAAPISDSYMRDRYNTHYNYGALPVDRYLPPSKREEFAPGSYSMGGRREDYRVDTDRIRRETERADRSYSTYASDALSEYNQQAVVAPVSSRYSFAGPSLSYR